MVGEPGGLHHAVIRLLVADDPGQDSTALVNAGVGRQRRDGFGHHAMFFGVHQDVWPPRIRHPIWQLAARDI
jgi:hypothetical protein